MRYRTLWALAAIGATAVLPIPVDRASAASDADAVAAATDAFSGVVTDAGFVSDGPIDDDPDVFDVVVDDDGSDAASYACTAGIAALVAGDGSLIGETARAFSDSYSYAGDGTGSTEPLGLSDADNVTASALAVDDDGSDELEAIVAAFGGDELRECVLDSFASMGTTADDSAVAVDVDDDLGIGDQSSSFTITSSAEAFRFDSTLLFARVDDRLATIIFFRAGGPDSGFDPTVALAAMADALAA